MAKGRFRTGPSFDDRATGKFSGMPSSRYSGPSYDDRATRVQSYPSGRRTGPSFSDAATGKRSGMPRATDFNVGNQWVNRAGDAVGKMASGIANTGRNISQGFMHPFQMMAGSIANNQAQHDYLDEVYGDKKGSALWKQATDQFYDRGMYAPGSLEPATTGYGASFGDIDDRGGTRGGVSFGQSKKYLNRAGVTDQALEKFIKENKSDAWLRAQADSDKIDLFDTGLSFIKNAKATANLARATQAAQMENQMYGGRDLGGPSFDDSATRVRSYPEDIYADFRSGIEQEGGAPRSYPIDEVTEDITADVAGPYTLDALDLMPSDLDEQRQKTIFQNRFTGQKHDPYRKEALTTYPHDISSYDITGGYPGMEVMNTMSPGETSMWRDAPGRGAANMDRLYMNRIGDVINQGRYSAAPNISVSFDEEEELTPAERYNPKINPSWNR